MRELVNAELLNFTLCKREHTMPLERTVLPYLDLTFLLSGRMVYYYNDKQIVLQGGDAILIPQGGIRQRQEDWGPVWYASINIRFDDPPAVPVTGHVPGGVGPNTLQVLEMINEVWSTAASHSRQQCNALYGYLYYNLLDAVLDRQDPTVRAIKGYIRQHLGEKLTLQEIAAHVYLTPEYCCALFKKHTGQTVFAYITGQRIEQAKRLIQLGEYSLQQVAARVGYTDYSYFSRVFRRVAGVTPMAYRLR